MFDFRELNKQTSVSGLFCKECILRLFLHFFLHHLWRKSLFISLLHIGVKGQLPQSELAGLSVLLEDI